MVLIFCFFFCSYFIGVTDAYQLTFWLISRIDLLLLNPYDSNQEEFHLLMQEL